MITKMIGAVIGVLIVWAGLTLCVELFLVMFFDEWLGALPLRPSIGLSCLVLVWLAYKVGENRPSKDFKKAEKIVFDPKVWN